MLVFHSSFCKEVSIFVTWLRFGGPDLHITASPRIVKSTESHVAPAEGLVRGCHDGSISTVCKQGDCSLVGIANQAKLVPGVFVPVKSIGPVTLDSDSGFVIDQEATMGVVIWLGGDVAVIELGTVMEVIKQAHVPVSVIFASLLEFALQNEISQSNLSQ